MVLDHLNQQQKEAVTHTKGRMLIVAGAGTGKTTVLTNRCLYLIENGLASAEEILIITFTEKATNEMRERLDVLAPYGSFFEVHTFHGFADKLLREFAFDFGLSPSFNLATESKSWKLVYKNINDFVLDYYKPLSDPTRLVTALIKAASRLKDELITEEDLSLVAKRMQLEIESKNLLDTDEIDDIELKKVNEIVHFYTKYNELLLKNNLLDFGDLIYRLVTSLRKRPNVREKIKQKYKYIMVDEFQDTNYGQFELLKLIEDSNLTVVGDDDQAIYSFRGASFVNIMEFTSVYPDARQIVLGQNYRSCQNILDLAYKVIQNNNPNRLESKLSLNKRLVAKDLMEGKISLSSFGHIDEEVAFMTKEIKKILKQKGKTVAVLVRTNSLGQVVSNSLTVNKIKHTFSYQEAFFSDPFAVFLIKILMFFNSVYDDQVFLALCRSERFLIEEGDLQRIAYEAKKRSLHILDACKEESVLSLVTSRARLSIAGLTSFINKQKQAMALGVQEGFLDLMLEIGLIDELALDVDDKRRDVFAKFYKRVIEFEADNKGSSLVDFVNDLVIEIESGDKGFGGEVVSDERVGVVTVHASKGLEFDYVFMPSLIERRFPSDNKKDGIDLSFVMDKETVDSKDAHIEEERRLFYVAATRARTGLYLSYSYNIGGKQQRKASRFIEETGLMAMQKSIRLAEVSKEKVEIKKQKLQFVVPKRFTFTQLSTFKQCPLEYRFRYCLALPVKGSFHASFGSSVHNALEETVAMYMSGYEVSEGLGLEMLDKHWINSWYKSKKHQDEYKLHGRLMVRRVISELLLKKPVVKFLEKSFDLPIFDEYILSGRIDRVDDEDGKLTVIDYKTGKHKKNDKQAVDQLALYQLALNSAGFEVGNMFYWYLGDNDQARQKSEVVIFSQEDKVRLKEQVRSEIEDIANAILADDFEVRHSMCAEHRCEFG